MFGEDRNVMSISFLISAMMLALHASFGNLQTGYGGHAILSLA